MPGGGAVLVSVRQSRRARLPTATYHSLSAHRSSVGEPWQKCFGWCNVNCGRNAVDSPRHAMSVWRSSVRVKPILAVLLVVIVVVVLTSGSHGPAVPTLVQQHQPSAPSSAATAAQQQRVAGHSAPQRTHGPRISAPRRGVALRPEPRRVAVEAGPAVELMWQLADAGRSPDAAVLLFHGCGHSAASWFTYPEHAAVVRELLDPTAQGGANVLVIAFSSRAASRAGGGCWDTSFEAGTAPNEDVSRVHFALEALLLARGEWPPTYPLAGIGASSGGSFVTVLAHGRPELAPLAAQAVYISAGVTSAVDPAACSTLPEGRCPATAFVHMPRDEYTAARVANAHDALTWTGTPVMIAECHPQPLLPATLAHKLPHVTSGMSLRVYNALMKAGYLTRTGELKEDPRQSAWMAVARDAASSRPDDIVSLDSMEHGMQELLNVLYAQHEMTSQHFTSVAAFLRLHMGVGLAM